MNPSYKHKYFKYNNISGCSHSTSKQIFVSKLNNSKEKNIYFN